MRAKRRPPAPFDLLVDKNGQKVSSRDIWCMATAIYFEARGEAYRGQVAVGQVVMNRVAHKIYPKHHLRRRLPEPADAQCLPVLVRLRRQSRRT